MPNRQKKFPSAMRTKVVQLHIQGISLNGIADRLAQDRDPWHPEKALWDELPSRGTIQNWVTAWDRLPEEIRIREQPFELHSIDLARIPWEATWWVLECRYLYIELWNSWATDQDARLGESEGRDAFNRQWQPFSNRLATWCWRIHLAAPDYLPDTVILFALEYASIERFHDLTDNDGDKARALMALQAWGDWFTFRPDFPAELDDRKRAVDNYRQAIRRKLAQPVPEGNVFSMIHGTTGTQGPERTWHALQAIKLRDWLKKQQDEKFDVELFKEADNERTH